MLDALIIGAGPTGLTLAIELAKRGLSVRIIDQLERPMTQSRALGLQSRTLEIFEKMGLIHHFLKTGHKIEKLHLYLNKKTFLKLDLNFLEAPYPFVLSIPQAQTEEILTNALKNLGIEIERGATLLELTHEEALVKHLDGSQEKIKAAWFFGCDGAHSTVRQCLNFPFEGKELPETFSLADVEIETSLPSNEASIFLRKEGIIGFLPLPRSRWYRIIMSPQAETEDSLTLSSFQKIASKHVPIEMRLLQSEWITSFKIHRRLVPQMRKKNIFLLGDAAHIHSPVGGQGLNTSVQDAYNLSWKIALVHQNLGKEILLTSFQAERHPIAKSVLQYTTAATHILTSSSLLRGYLLRWLSPLIRCFFCCHFAQRKIALQVSEIGLSYKKSPIIDISDRKQSLKAGMRAPDALLPSGARLFTQMQHPLHTLLCFGQIPEILSLVQTRYSPTIRIITVDLSPPSPIHSIYHVTAPCCYLIRPDGYISFHSDVKSVKSFFSYLKRIFEDQKSYSSI